jgi:hypothetical protein
MVAPRSSHMHGLKLSLNVNASMRSHILLLDPGDPQALAMRLVRRTFLHA